MGRSCGCGLGSTDDDMMTAEDFVLDQGITASIKHKGVRPSFPNLPARGHPVDEWEVFLRKGDRGYRVPFYMGEGHHGNPPEIEDVLDSLASDASVLEASRDVRDFASEMSFVWSDPRERLKAINIFKQIQNQTARLKQFLGPKAFDTLLYKVERR